MDRPRKEQTRFAKHLRKNLTGTEALMWSLLKGKRLGVKFRRQTPVGPYVVDFLCEEKRLIVELDGSQHVERKAYDDRRTAYLEARGYRVLRFWDTQLFKEMDLVMGAIREAAGRSPHSARLQAGTSPVGRGNIVCP